MPRSEETPLDTTQIVRAIDAEIDRLSKARALLTGYTAPLKRGLPRSAPKSRKISAESRARMAAAQTARRKREKPKT
jgi:hypothetical protein